MAKVASEDMVRALGALRRAGIHYHRTRAMRREECGCRTVTGWDTVKLEPFAGFEPCSEHGLAAERAKARYFDPEVMARFHDVQAIESMMTLLEEEIEQERPFILGKNE